MERFPYFLRLPYVALSEVIVTIERSDIIHLALSSRKMCRLVNLTKNSVSLQKLSQDVIDELDAKDKLNIIRLESRESHINVKKTMELRISKELSLKFLFAFCSGDDNRSRSRKRSLSLEFQINSTDDKIRGNQEIMRFGDMNVRVIINSKDTFSTIWEDTEIGFQFLSRHFLQQFKLNQTVLNVKPDGIDGSKFSRLLDNALDIVEYPLNDKPELLIDKMEMVTDSDLQMIFHDVAYSKIKMQDTSIRRLPENFSCVTMSLTIHESEWFSIRNLLNSRCGKVTLGGSRMTNRDMNKVLINWIDGKLETLGSLFIELKEGTDFEVILSGLADRTGCVVYRTECTTTIKRRDERRATFAIFNGNKIFNMTIS